MGGGSGEAGGGVGGATGECWELVGVRHALSHGLPRVVTFSGFVRLEIEVPSLAVNLGQLIHLFSHEPEVLLVVYGAEQVPPEVERAFLAGGRTWQELSSQLQHSAVQQSL